MSAPTSSAPLVVNTRDGKCWTRLMVTSSGIALYGPEGVCSCPGVVMATLPELAELGISGSADVLPVPVGPEPQTLISEQRDQIAELIGSAKPATDGLLLEMAQQIRDRREHDHSTAADWDWFCLNASGWLGDKAPTVLRRLLDAEARVAELEAERHSTNESLSEAAEQLRADRDRIAELEKREAIVAEFVTKRAEYITAIRNCHPDNAHDYDRWQGHAAARRQLAELLGLPVTWPTDAPAPESGAGATQ